MPLPFPSIPQDVLIPLPGTSTSLADDSLAPLRRIGRSARVIALGEPTHGQREVYALRHRISRYLVEQMGVTVIAIEANATECEAANRFVKTGEGTASDAAAGMSYWLYRTEEMRDVLDWVRTWNATSPPVRQVRIAGIDAQHPAKAASRLAERLAGDDAPNARLRAALQTLSGLSLWNRQPNEPSSADLRTALDEVRTGLDTPSHADGDDLRLLEQFLLMRDARTGAAGWDVRDRAMAGNVLRYAEAHKIVVWAHNGHVMKDAGWPFGPAPTPMGAHLARQLGDRFVSIGFAFGAGSLRAVVDAGSGHPRIDTVNVGPPPAGSLDAMLLSATGTPAALLDLRAAGGDLRKWLDQMRVSRTTGADFTSEEETHATLNVLRAYDALVFVRETTGTRPL